jgi:hypothetical protein
MAEFQIKIVNQNRQLVADTYVDGEDKEDVLVALRGAVDDALNGDDSWADPLEEEFS